VYTPTIFSKDKIEKGKTPCAVNYFKSSIVSTIWFFEEAPNTTDWILCSLINPYASAAGIAPDANVDIAMIWNSAGLLWSVIVVYEATSGDIVNPILLNEVHMTTPFMFHAFKRLYNKGNFNVIKPGIT